MTTTDIPYLGCYSSTHGDELLFAILNTYLSTDEYRNAVRYGWNEESNRFVLRAQEEVQKDIHQMAKHSGLSAETGFSDTAAREAWMGWLEEATTWIWASYWDERRKARQS